MQRVAHALWALRAKPSGLLLATVIGQVGLSLPFVLLLSWGRATALSGDPTAQWTTMIELVRLGLLLGVVCVASLLLLMSPIAHWLSGDQAQGERRIQRIAIYTSAVRVLYPVIVTSLWIVWAAIATGNDRSLGSLLFVATLVLGPWPICYSLASWLVSPAAQLISHSEQSLEGCSRAPRRRLTVQLAAYGICLALSPAIYVASIAIICVERGAALRELVYSVSVYGAAVVAYGLTTALLLGNTLLGPIRAIRQRLDQIRDGSNQLIERVPIEIADEVGELGISANRMLDRLEQTERERRTYRLWIERSNEMLETRVAERTFELSCSFDALRATQKQLVDTARQAGMAEIATGVLHNIGNVVTSVNIAAATAAHKLHDSSLPLLERVAQLLVENRDSERFLVDDQRGRRIPWAVQKIAAALRSQHDGVRGELSQLQERVAHVIAIIGSQQRLARESAVAAKVTLGPLLQRAFDLAGLADGAGLTVDRAYDAELELEVNEHRLLQIIVNLLSNARQAVLASAAEERRVAVCSRCKDGVLSLEIRDNGVGIDAQTIGRIFENGFTTKADGHGFGLHVSAIAARELGGDLRASSDGAGQGASFELDVPLTPPDMARRRRERVLGPTGPSPRARA
ncbi:MAG: HAMP domain-containing protein [Myxococcales bacterium]|nr:HAMP domain-containing protein [Myxococcales bacterium]